jgi:hypothetical protein
VLGTRWVYDGPHDPVLAGQLLALIQGEAEPQAQRVSNAADRTVTSHFAGPRVSDGPPPVRVTSGPDATDLVVPRAADADLDSGTLQNVTIRVSRVLKPILAEPRSPGYVTATWRAPDGTEARGLFAEVRA